MTPLSDTELARLREEIAVATFSDGGLLVRLTSGDVFQLDAAAASVMGAIATAPDARRAVESIQTALGISAEDARRLVEATVRQALQDSPPASPAPIFRIEDAGSSIPLCRDGRPVLVFDRGTLRLGLGDDATGPTGAASALGTDTVEGVIRLFIPKVLATWFPLAMHASAVRLGARAIVFSGISGAGKTTTARALAEDVAGAALISEDIVLFSKLGDQNLIVEGAERVVRAWIADASETLERTPAASVDAATLGRALAALGAVVPLGKIIFLDVARRIGPAWSLRVLGRGEALRFLFLNSFLPSVTPGALRSHLAACRLISAAATAAEAVVIPAGIASLRSSNRLQHDLIVS